MKAWLLWPNRKRHSWICSVRSYWILPGPLLCGLLASAGEVMSSLCKCPACWLALCASWQCNHMLFFFFFFSYIHGTRRMRHFVDWIVTKCLFDYLPLVHSPQSPIWCPLQSTLWPSNAPDYYYYYYYFYFYLYTSCFWRKFTEVCHFVPTVFYSFYTQLLNLTLHHGALNLNKLCLLIESDLFLV